MQVGELIRKWRKSRKKSQLELALDVGVSAKHISFVETGRSGVSRKLLVAIAKALNIPAASCNAALRSAGYAGETIHPALNDDEHEAVKKVLQTLLDKHDPFPAVALDASYDFVGYNRSFSGLVAYFLGEEAPERFDNLLLLTFSDDGLRPFFHDADRLQAFMYERVKQEFDLIQNKKIAEVFSRKVQAEASSGPSYENPPLPVVNFRMQKGTTQLSFFSVVTTFGTPLDVRAGEFRIETLYPSDDATEKFLQNGLNSFLN